jgi:hypothetical protein
MANEAGIAYVFLARGHSVMRVSIWVASTIGPRVGMTEPPFLVSLLVLVDCHDLLQS